MSNMTTNGKGITRRTLLAGAGQVAVGAAIAAVGGSSLIDIAEAKGAGKSFGYKKLDVDKVGEKAYEDYGKVFCAQTVVGGLVEELAKEVGGQWKKFPVQSAFWGHGGITGWGTACGALVGAATVVGLALDDKKVAERVVNDIMAYYAYTNLPVYKPKKAIIADIKNRSKAGTPLCHISVGKWMAKENVKFFSKARKERCGRISADIAMHTAMLLNQVADGTYKPSHGINAKTYAITTQENCTECHGKNVPTPPTKG
jgi:hypothetical protein